MRDYLAPFRRLKALYFDALFWMPFWLIPLLISQRLEKVSTLKSVAVGIGFSAFLSLVANLAGRWRRYIYLSLGLAAWCGAGAFVMYATSTHARINGFGLYDASVFVTRDSRMFSWVAGVGPSAFWLLLLSTPLILLWKKWPVSTETVSLPTVAVCAVLVVLPFVMRLAVCAAIPCQIEAARTIVENVLRRYPPALSYLAVADMLALRERLREIARTRPPNERVVRVADAHPLSLIVVVGETLSRGHMGLYGYCRDTTPYLSGHTDELFRFTDLLSPIPSTALAVPDSLTIKSANTSIIDILNDGGFETFWISSQASFGEHSSATVFWAGKAKHKVWLAPPFEQGAFFQKDVRDDSLLAPFYQALQLPIARKAIFLHMNGAHWTYADRYPAGYLAKGFAPLRNRTRTEDATISEYDRAIHFDDDLFGRIIEEARKQSGDVAIVIFSDHGEEVYDQKRWFTHIFPGATRAMLEPPLVVWLSPSLRSRRPDLVASMNAARSLRLTISDISPFLVQMSGLSVRGLASAAEPLSPTFLQLPRYSGTHNYDRDKNVGAEIELGPACGIK